MDATAILLGAILAGLAEMRWKVRDIGRRLARVEKIARYYAEPMPTLVEKERDASTAVLPAIKLSIAFVVMCCLYSCGDVVMARAGAATTCPVESPAAEVSNTVEYLAAGVMVLTGGLRVAAFWPTLTVLAFGGWTSTVLIVAASVLACAFSLSWLLAHPVVLALSVAGTVGLIAYRHRRQLATFWNRLTINPKD